MEKKIAVVTGASKGIGLRIAEVLLREGYDVFGFSRTVGKLEAVRWISCDVTDTDSVKESFQTVLKEAGKIDLLVCNAGIGISGATEFTSEKDYQRQMDVNLLGAVRCTQQVIEPMRTQKKGKIIFISSLAAIFPLPFQSFYSASKAGLNSFSDALGIEMKPFGVETCVVMLNDVKTEFTANRKKTEVGDDIYDGRIQASVAKMEKSEQSGMTPETVAETVGGLLRRRKLPAHKIVGLSNEFLGLLYRILPSDFMLWLLGKIYG